MFFSVTPSLRLKDRSSNKFSYIPTLVHYDTSASFPHSEAEMLNKYLCSSFNKSNSLMSVHPPSLLSFPCPQDLKCTPNEIFHLLSCLPSDNSPGLDKKSVPMLKSMAHFISSPLSLIFNSYFSFGTFAFDWKSPVIIPIPKTSSPLSYLLEYRPISRLSLASKIFECHVFHVLSNIISMNEILATISLDFKLSSQQHSPCLH